MIRPVLVNSIPKAGTHLVSKALSLVPGIDGEYARLAPTGFEAQPGEATVSIGIGLARPVSAQRVRETLADLAPGQFALWHVPYSQAFDALLRELNVSMLLVVRDPRDVAVSHAMHIAQFAGHRLHNVFVNMSDEDRLAVVIDGLRDAAAGETLLEPLAVRYARLLEWRAYDPVHVVRFEDLVGERGGGSAEKQSQSLRDMLRFIGVPATADVTQLIADNMFGDTVTFRRGKIGAWREHLNIEQVQRIEDSCGDVMRELGYAFPESNNHKPRATSNVPPFIVNSFPKSGTKLLCKVCAMLPGVKQLPANANWRALSMVGEGWYSAPSEGTAGTKPERPTTIGEAEELLNAVSAGGFIEHHIAYSRELAALLQRRDMRMLMMVRDPRDAVVSLVNYLLKAAHHPLHAFFSALPEHERLTRAIIGVRGDETGGAELSDIGARYRRRVGWMNDPIVCVMRFEDLVGPAGGGDAQRQHQSLHRLLHHLGMDARPELVTQLAHESYGGTRTFHQGTIGRWRDVFTDEHRTLFRGLAGDILDALGYDTERDS